MKLARWIPLIGLILACSACSTKPTNIAKKAELPKIELNQSLFAPVDPPIISPTEIFTLTPKQQQEFLAYYQNRVAGGERPDEVIGSYLTNKLSHFTYYGDTFDAKTSLDLSKGNCMSLAVVTTALAQLVGLEIDYIEVNTLPIYEKRNGVIMSSTHVQSRIYPPLSAEATKSVFSWLRDSTIIDYFPSEGNRRGKRVSTNEFLAKFYNNLAGEALAKDKLDLAFSYAQMAVKQAPQYTETLNILAVLHKRKGDVNTAEKLYLTALAYDKKNLRLLSNYIELLKSQKRYEAASTYEAKLSQLDDPNPYAWLEQAYLYQEQGKTSKAIHSYKKVIEKAPYLQEAYLDLYHLHLQQGQYQRASKVLSSVFEWTYDAETRKKYNKKLYLLTNSQK